MRRRMRSWNNIENEKSADALDEFRNIHVRIEGVGRAKRFILYIPYSILKVKRFGEFPALYWGHYGRPEENPFHSSPYPLPLFALGRAVEN